MRRKIVHFILDEKFIDSAIELFSKIENVENEYILIRNVPFQKRKYVINPLVKECNRWIISHVIHKQDFANVVILHSLYSLPIDLIPLIPVKIKVVWFSWGYDIYSPNPPLKPLINIQNIYWKRTKDYLLKEKIEESDIFSYKKYLRKMVSNFLWPKNEKILVGALSRIDFYSGVIPIEYDSLKSYLPNAKLVDFNYPISKDITTSCDWKICKRKKSNSILIGNSATETNNHVDVFYLLKNLDLNLNFKLIVPLSYGSISYRDFVIKEGYKLFNTTFVPLIHYMAFDEYQKILNTCSVAIFATERQQAVGNILIMIWLGKKVFLSDTSILYKYFIGIGLKVFSIQKDLISLFDEFSLECIMNNREIISKRYSNNALIKRASQMIKEIEK